jgi:hypothetical protein
MFVLQIAAGVVPAFFDVAIFLSSADEMLV